MTNSKSVDNYRFMTAEPFVMNNRAYCLIDGVQFVIYTIAPEGYIFYAAKMAVFNFVCF